MSQALISSRQNALIKRVRRLQQKKYRQREKAFFVEGIRVVLTALEQGAPVETLLYAPELLTSDVARQAVEAHVSRGANVVAVTADVFQSISGKDDARGLGAVVVARSKTPEGLVVGEDDVFVALEDVSDPGNLGTIIRTVDAVGAAGVILVGQSTDPYHPTAVRASMGAIFAVSLATVDSIADLRAWARKQNLQMVATSAHARQSFWDATYRLPALLLLGNEGEGLADDVQAQADLAVSIPMVGVSSSLNLAVAAGLLLYEMRRRMAQD